MATLPLPEYVSQASTLTQENTILQSKYGDNYAQYAEWGTNAKTDKWSLSWEGLTTVQRNTLYDFFEANGLWAAWQWTDPITLVEKQWRFTTPMKTNVTAGLYSISASIAQDYRIPTS